MDRTQATEPHGGNSGQRAPAPTPRTAIIWEVLRGELHRQGGRSLTVIDVGGGTGGFAVPLAQAGHQVTVVDESPDALAALTRRAAEAGTADRVTAVQGDGDQLAEIVTPGSADLILCHSVLEVVDAPAEVVDALAAALRPGGAASVVVANRAAAVLARVLAGHPTVAQALLTAPDGRAESRDAESRDTVRRRYDAGSAAALLGKAGLVVEQTHGVRVVSDLAPADTDPAALLAFELAVAAVAPYRDIATQLHLLARKS